MRHLNPKILLSALIGLSTGCSHLDEKPDLLNEAKKAYQQAYLQTHANNELVQAAEFIHQAEQAQEPEEIAKWTRLAKEKIHAAILQHNRSSQAEMPKKILGNLNDDAHPQHWQEILTGFRHRETSQGWVLRLDNTHFEGTHLLTPTQSKLSRLAAFLKQNPKHLVSIESSIENLGDKTYSLGLAQRIAEEVRLTLLQRGVSSNRVTVKSSIQEVPPRKSPVSLNHHVDITVFGETFR